MKIERIQRICLYGGPSSGKSTLAAWLFANLKMKGESVEAIPEHVKFWTYLPHTPQSFDQFYLFGQQLHHEDTVLRGGVNFLICETPLLLVAYYAKRMKTPGAKLLFEAALEVERVYPGVHLFIERGDEYCETGRFHSKKEAVEIDKEMKEFIEQANEDQAYSYAGSFSVNDKDTILRCVGHWLLSHRVID